MWDMDLNGFSTAIAAILLSVLAIAGCRPEPVTEAPRTLQIQQTWELQPGDAIAGYPVIGGLGDVSLNLNGDAVYAPVDGRLQPYTPECAIFSSAEIPIYLFRLCGLKHPQYGQLKTGEKIGSADTLNFALLNRRSEDGKWAFVEPSKQILEQMLQPL